MEAKQLDIKRCFIEAFSVYKVNIPMLLLTTLVFQLISLFTLLIMSGPLFGGYCYMVLNAMRSPDKKIEFNDIFKTLNRFWPLFGLFFLQGFAIFAGFLLLIIPGILLMTMWLYSYFMAVDKGYGPVDSLKASWNMVKGNGFWINLALAVIYIVINGLAGQIPFVGLIISLFVVPFGALLITSAYIQQSQQGPASSGENRPFANVCE
ncbi:MAG: hypothetical protein PHV77_02650 [Candidatus Omnitrophica bacterium]|nr:hypothetical protein [Candidatus Omnitrophota bacterium]